jgi:ABC-2 type transport system ATP-binding protein
MKICGNVYELVEQYTKRQGFQLKLGVKGLDELQVKESLKLVSGISSIVKDNGHYLVNSGVDISEDVSKAVSRANGVITELEVYRPSLNEIFLDITKPEQEVKESPITEPVHMPGVKA